MGGAWLPLRSQTRLCLIGVYAAAHSAHQRGRVTSSAPARSAGVLDDAIPVLEPAEEVRLLLCRITMAVVTRATATRSASLLHPYAHGLILAAHAFAVDPFPDLRVEGCHLLVLVARMVC